MTGQPTGVPEERLFTEVDAAVEGGKSFKGAKSANFVQVEGKTWRYAVKDAHKKLIGEVIIERIGDLRWVVRQLDYCY